MRQKSDRPEQMQKLIRKQLRRIKRKEDEKLKKTAEYASYLDSLDRGISTQ